MFRIREARVEEAVGAKIFKVDDRSAPGGKPTESSASPGPLR
jgi:hypothetical protein